MMCDFISFKFILMVKKGKGLKIEYVFYVFDFVDFYECKCEKSDFEDWWICVDDKGELICIMGYK